MTCLLLPEFMVMWRWENSLQNECSGPTLQMLQVNCYNQTYQCSQAPEWLQSYKRQTEWPLLTSTPYLDIFQYVWELPCHAHEYGHILSAWQLSSRLDGAITCLGVVSLKLLQHTVCHLDCKSIMLEFARGNVESCKQDSKTLIPKVQHKNSHNNFTNLLDPNTQEL